MAGGWFGLVSAPGIITGRDSPHRRRPSVEPVDPRGHLLATRSGDRSGFAAEQARRRCRRPQTFHFVQDFKRSRRIAEAINFPGNPRAGILRFHGAGEIAHVEQLGPNAAHSNPRSPESLKEVVARESSAQCSVDEEYLTVHSQQSKVKTKSDRDIRRYSF